MQQQLKQGSKPLLGVLGGMGPLATVDFLRKLIEETPAQRDEEHVPVLVYSVPQIPERPPAILAGGESPLPAMLQGIATLRGGGAHRVAIACNTAHYWYDDLVAGGGLPIMHIADAAVESIRGRGLRADRIGLIATNGTHSAGFYQARFAALGLECVVNSAEEQRELIDPGIYAVKRNELDFSGERLTAAVRALRNRGAQAIVLGCTEVPVGLDHAAPPELEICVDATRALAQTCVRWWQASTGVAR